MLAIVLLLKYYALGALLWYAGKFFMTSKETVCLTLPFASGIIFSSLNAQLCIMLIGVSSPSQEVALGAPVEGNPFTAVRFGLKFCPRPGPSGEAGLPIL